jgi:teichoic acid transport system ATP-binding protein
MASASAGAEPLVVVDNVHVVYRVWGATARQGEKSMLQRLRIKSSDLEIKKVHALRGVSLVARRGESIGLIGSNGSGKSTLLSAIAGGLPPAQGAIYSNSRPTLLGVNAALIDNLTGERNVVLGCLAMGMKPSEIEAKFSDIVEFSGVGDFINLPMNAYSSGMAARLRFAIGAAFSPEVLLIDEALATGDAQFMAKSRKRIAELQENAGVVFLVHHSTSEIRANCNRVIWLQNGVAVMDGDVDEVTAAYEESIALG